MIGGQSGVIARSAIENPPFHFVRRQCRLNRRQQRKNSFTVIKSSEIGRESLDDNVELITAWERMFWDRLSLLCFVSSDVQMHLVCCSSLSLCLSRSFCCCCCSMLSSATNLMLYMILFETLQDKILIESHTAHKDDKEGRETTTTTTTKKKQEKKKRRRKPYEGARDDNDADDDDDGQRKKFIPEEEL